MTAHSGSPQWRDPWPSPEAAWLDPPWLMSGRAVTAWFPAPWDVVEKALSPDLLPEPAPFLRSRLRFYDLRFQARGSAPVHAPPPRDGRFREAVVAFPARFDELDGEVSVFLWTDSDAYMTWGREAFGWPVTLAQVALSGPLWSSVELLGLSGECRVEPGSGVAAVTEISVTGVSSSSPPSGHWLTPRRLLHAAGNEGETRELLVVRPAVKAPGKRYSATGRVRFDFPSPHLLHALAAADAEVEVADGFELLVGADVEVLGSVRRWRNDGARVPSGS